MNSKVLVVAGDELEIIHNLQPLPVNIFVPDTANSLLPGLLLIILIGGVHLSLLRVI